MPKSYSNWLSWFDGWPAERIAALQSSPPAIHRPLISALVFRADPANEQGLALTLASLIAQIQPAFETVIREPGEAAGLAENVLGEYVAVVQAGEILPPHAFLLLGEELVRQNFPDIVFADEDLIDEHGVRSHPLFKPQPNLTLMCSALLSRGVWLIRREWLETMPRSDYAECVRLEAWFAVYEAGRAAATHRVPYLLTHRSAHTESARPETLAAVVESFLGRAGFEATVTSSFPLRIQWQPGALRRTKITLIVPSCLRGDTQLNCLRQILDKTTYPNYEMLVLVTQAEEFDAEQRRAIAELGAHEKFRVHRIAEPVFNYSAANNIGAKLATGAFLCLLNDDVAPIDGDWLDRMVGFFADPNCAIVGAKLFYPNLTTQHGGVIMGLAGLVEHANRFLPRGNPGYAWRAELDQELSAVTGACLLVRRAVFDAVHGLDENFPTAFNDVDFCLRVREQGFGIVFAASVELIHHETLTFGRHYDAEATGQEHADIIRLRARWSKICKTDPFHNPNLSLIGRSEWNLAYPPRKQDEPAA
jgi:GT2 family glycosyltransferase